MQFIIVFGVEIFRRVRVPVDRLFHASYLQHPLPIENIPCIDPVPKKNRKL